MPNPLHNPFTPEHKLPKKRLFGGDKTERQPFAHIEAAEEEQELEHKLEGQLFECHGFELNWESYKFITALEKQMKENQKNYPEEGEEWERKWTDKEIEEKIIKALKKAKIEDGAVTRLSLDSMRLQSLPDLPETLTRLKCSYNQLQSLPDLPETLTHLSCHHNQLQSLPDLPKTLTYLYCDNNQLPSLPNLSEALITLNCSYNQLQSLPDLPETLTRLSCDNNRLQSLPDLPKTLTTLYCTYNQLQSLPDLPKTLTYLNCKKNQFPPEEINRIKQERYVRFLEI